MSKYLIVGLGNPGAKYINTRHNIGFRCLDLLAQKSEIAFSPDRYGDLCTIKYRGKQLVLLKPGTFMNLSGKAVRFHLNKHKIPIDNTLIITDDISLPFGKLRLRAKGSAGGHNGLQSIIDLLGTPIFARLKFGVGNDFMQGQQSDYVLSDFSIEEEKLLPELLEQCGKIIYSFASQGIQRAMSSYN